MPAMAPTKASPWGSSRTTFEADRAAVRFFPPSAMASFCELGVGNPASVHAGPADADLATPPHDGRKHLLDDVVALWNFLDLALRKRLRRR